MRSASMLVAMVTLLALAVALVPACTSDPPAGEPPCVAGLSLDCRPLYNPPIYTTLFEKIFHPTCASGTGTCHTTDGHKANLVFEDADTAYALLLGTADGRKRVLPGDPACSLVMKRLESLDPGYRMPPGTAPLSPAERCAITRWIADGAKR